MSMNAICAPMRPRSSSSKKRLYHASASSMSPTSSATWLIPTRRAIPPTLLRLELLRQSRCSTSVEGRPPDERELAVRAQRGDSRAYEELVRPHQEIAFRVAYVITRNSADAEDALQDGLTKAWRALGRFRVDEPLRPWLLRIVANEARNARRSARPRGRPL